MDEIKAKDRIIFSLEKELETQTGYVQKLRKLQKEALDRQLFLVKEAECNMSSPEAIPGRAGVALNTAAVK